MRTHDPRRRRFFLFPVFFILLFFLLAAVVRYLWNAILVDVIGVKPVSLWQAMGLLVLSRLLVGGFKFGPPGNRPPFGGHSPGRPNWREKWRSMSDEDRARFKEEWKRRFRGH